MSLLTDHGRAIPLNWQTVDKRTLKDRLLIRLADILSPEVQVVADRGFGLLTEDLKFDFVIRFRANIEVTSAAGQTRTAASWMGPGGQARLLRGASVTAGKHRVGSVVCMRDPDMKQAWCLASSYARPREPLRQALGDRGRLARHQGPALLHWHGSVHVSTREQPDPAGGNLLYLGVYPPKNPPLNAVTRWNLVVSHTTGQNLRELLDSQGRGRKGELSRIVE